MKRTLFLLILLLCITLSAVEAAVLTSANFTIGYGYTGATRNGWTTTESSSVNSPTTQGSFTFSPTVLGEIWGGSGPTFPNLVLSNGTTDRVGDTKNFSVVISGSWTGATPADAAPSPNYQISIVITNLSIWGVTSTAAGGSATPLAFGETTSGHTATSSSISLNNLPNTASSFTTASNYKQLVWNPDDYSVSGTSTTRSFNIVAGDQERAIDGFQVNGYVLITYTAVPEPGSLATALVGLGLCVVLYGRRRSGK